MSIDLTGVQLKMERAHHHRDTLVREMESTYVDGAIQFVHSTREGGRVHAYEIQGLPAIPIGWSSIVGDCVHNARSALDHLAYEVVRSFHGTPKDGPGGTSFPLSASGSTPLRLAGLTDPPAQVMDILDSVQPRNPGAGFVGTFLGVLSELDNRDKHRGLLVVQYATNELDLAWGGEVDTPTPVVQVREKDFDNGDEVVTMTYRDPIETFNPSPRLPGLPQMMGRRHPRKVVLTRGNGRERPNESCYYASL